MISIAFFNFAGVSVTKELSATTRTVLDSVRKLVIWSVSLLLHWQKFYWPQVVSSFFSFSPLIYNILYIDDFLMVLFRLSDSHSLFWECAFIITSLMVQCANVKAKRIRNRCWEVQKISLLTLPELKKVDLVLFTRDPL